MSKLFELWAANIKANVKLISAFLTEMIITAIIMIAYGLKAGQSVWDILFTIWVSSNTALFIIMRLIGKGEVADVEEKLRKVEAENEHLKEKAGYDQVIAGYAIQLAALKGQVPESIIYNEKWIDANEILKKTSAPADGTDTSYPETSTSHPQ